MNSLRWRALVVAAFMLVGALLAYVGRPTVYLADRLGKPDLEVLFPRQFGPWQVDTHWPVIVPPPDVQAALNAIYNQVLTRTYVNSKGQRIMLSVAYGGDQYDGTSAHRPEACYPAQGFSITFNQTRVQALGQDRMEVRNLVAKLGGRNEPITYWIVVGDTTATTGVQQKLAQLRWGLKGVIADGLLVRVSSIDADAPRAHGVQAGFIEDMAAAMPAAARTRVFGQAVR
jgi:EpsI family protein